MTFGSSFKAVELSCCPYPALAAEHCWLDQMNGRFAASNCTIRISVFPDWVEVRCSTVDFRWLLSGTYLSLEACAAGLGRRPVG